MQTLTWLELLIALETHFWLMMKGSVENEKCWGGFLSVWRRASVSCLRDRGADIRHGGAEPTGHPNYTHVTSVSTEMSEVWSDRNTQSFCRIQLYNYNISKHLTYTVATVKACSLVIFSSKLLSSTFHSTSHCFYKSIVLCCQVDTCTCCVEICIGMHCVD